MATKQEQLDQALASAKWTESSKPLRELCLSSRLPNFAKVAKGSYKDINKQAHDTILIHSVQKSPYVIAEGFKINGKPAKERFAIPFTYGGWLEVMSEDLKHIKPITSVEELIKLAPKSFLVRSELKAVYSEPGCDQVTLNKVRKVCIGEKLNYCEQFQVDVKTGKKVVPRKFIRCKDSNKNNIFIDLDAKVQFNSISESSKVDAVHQMRDLLCKFRLPVTVHVIDENICTQLSRSFLPVFRLHGIYINELVYTSPAKIGANMVAIPSSTPLHLFEMINSKGSRSNELFKNVIKSCASQIVPDDVSNISLLENPPDPNWVAAGNSFLKGLQSKYKPGLDTISDQSMLSKVSKVKNPEEESLMLQEIEDIYRYVREGGEPPPSRFPPQFNSQESKINQDSETRSVLATKSVINDDPIYHDIGSIKEKKARDSVLKIEAGVSSRPPSYGVLATSATFVEVPPEEVPIKPPPQTENNESLNIEEKIESKTLSRNRLMVEKEINNEIRNDEITTECEPVNQNINDAVATKKDVAQETVAGSLDWMKIFQAPEDIISVQKKRQTLTKKEVGLLNSNAVIKDNDITNIENIKPEEIKSNLSGISVAIESPPPPPPPTPSLSKPKNNIISRVGSVLPHSAQPSKPKGPPPPPKKSPNLLAKNISNDEKANALQKHIPSTQISTNDSTKQFLVKEDIVSKQKAIFGNKIDKAPVNPMNSKSINVSEKAPVFSQNSVLTNFIQKPPQNSKSINVIEKLPQVPQDSKPMNNIERISSIKQDSKPTKNIEKSPLVLRNSKPIDVPKVESPKMAAKSDNLIVNGNSIIPNDQSAEMINVRTADNDLKSQVTNESNVRAETQRSTKYIYTSSSYDQLNDYDDSRNDVQEQNINEISENKKEKSTDCDSALIQLLCVHG